MSCALCCPKGAPHEQIFLPLPAAHARERIARRVLEAGKGSGKNVGGIGDNMTSNVTEKKSFSADWLARIPEHWNVSALKRVLSEPLKYGATESGDCDDRSLPRYLRITDFENDGSLRNDTFASLPEEIARDYWVNDGDVLFARSGATVGKTFLFRNYQGRACFAGYLDRKSVV